MTYDSACYDLAETFLEDSEEFRKFPTMERAYHVQWLARKIQRAIEDYIEDNVEGHHEAAEEPVK
jgi:hypothetical protein